MRKILTPLLATMVLGFASTAHSQVTNHTATMSGPNEAPPNSSPGTGAATLLINENFNEIRLQVDFTGLTAPTVAAHIHCCTPPPGTAPAATPLPAFPDFPLGVTSGSYDMTFDLLSPGTYNPAFIEAAGGTVALAATELVEGIRAGEAYFNIHTSAYPAGEIRGFLVAAPIPEPATYAMWGLGLVALAGAGRWRQRSSYKAARPA
ncbi:CHRD domain-containing protein [Massilia eurypsychrophila]|jgi:MYXO-CTERM domain-containing protein|uniref:CHRD domain-containing protein n=1 Tax=Massilia eurypsychrophila TaxID=1485217 RepID=UPI001E59677E|nr:CHRD domain-containing protein [Massilia eurypsychrophila]